MTFKQRRNNLKITTYSKVVAILSIVLIGFLLLFLTLTYYWLEQNKQVSKIATEHFEKEVNALLELNSESYVSLINDITYWDELVNFVEKKDVNWFNSSLSYLVDTNRIDYIDAYNLKGEFICKASTIKINSYGFIPKSIFTKLNKQKNIKFYQKIPEGVIEIYGATIHPSQDPFKNKTKPRGYLFFVKLMDANYFNNLEKIVGSKIEDYNSNSILEPNFISFHKQIMNYNGKEINTLLFKKFLNVNFSTTKKIMLAMLLAFFLSIYIFLFYAQKWTKRPMKLIKLVLENGDQDAVNELKNIRGEFRYIGKLFEENKFKTAQLIKAKRKAEESERLKSAFLKNLSHEIRTPMNAILGFSDLIQNTPLTDDLKNQYLAIIQKSGKNLVHIIDDLVEMSKIDSELITPNYSSLDFVDLIKTTFEEIKISNNKTAIDFKLVLPEVLPKHNIKTDAIKLKQIVSNLLSNAQKFTDEGFVVLDFTVDEDAKQITIEIKDSGIGIPDKFQKEIFQRFSKINAKGISANEGMGLGLAISKAYVDILGGAITFKSMIGIGTVFTVMIPFEYDYEIKDNKSNTKAIPSLGYEEILLVAEDDNINYLLIETMLKNTSFKIIRAKDGKEAVEACKNNVEIDLVLMDIKMPKLDGYNAFIQIKQFKKELPIIAHTAFSSAEEIDKIKKLGFEGYITKPINREELFSVLNRFLNKDEKK